jgi:hypothetical protein
MDKHLLFMFWGAKPERVCVTARQLPGKQSPLQPAEPSSSSSTPGGNAPGGFGAPPYATPYPHHQTVATPLCKQALFTTIDDTKPIKTRNDDPQESQDVTQNAMSEVLRETLVKFVCRCAPASLDCQSTLAPPHKGCELDAA